MKVYLRLSSHAIYEDLVKYPPPGVKYLYKTKTRGKGAERGSRNGLASVWRFYTNIRPPAIYVNAGGSDLIHSNAGVMILNKKPWVMDIEDVDSLANFNYKMFDSPRYKKDILSILNSKWCKCIMPYTFAAKKSIESKLPHIKGKLKVVYPAIHSTGFKKKKHEKTRLLFISTRFYEKGGPQILEAFEALSKKYDVELSMITNAPPEYERKYKGNGIEFMKPILSREELFKNHYPSSDIFLFPTHFDTFGLVMLEAMNFGLPIITLREYSTPEVVEDGKNGFLIDCKYVRDNFPQYSTVQERMDFLKSKPQKDVVKSMVEKCSFLIEDEKARKMMGRSGKRMIEDGRFSIKQRNKSLKSIYSESIGQTS
ncbi:MAG: hypothetical protein A2Y66_02150 [Nitrospirae bacterium RBG_13_41_22]|nr:MAG: hypothetical protein A2Y66_02150 [Nitrospirae bacterium RBG_13_41_22]